MKEIKYIPQCLEEGVFSGHLLLRKPSIDDLFEGSEIAGKEGQSEVVRTKELLKWSKKFYLEVEIKNIDESVYKNFDDLMGDSECLAILQEVAMALVTGINKKKLTALTTVPKKEKSSSK